MSYQYGNNPCKIVRSIVKACTLIELHPFTTTIKKYSFECYVFYFKIVSYKRNSERKPNNVIRRISLCWVCPDLRSSI